MNQRKLKAFRRDLEKLVNRHGIDSALGVEGHLIADAFFSAIALLMIPGFKKAIRARK